jgi:hypothetical protein
MLQIMNLCYKEAYKELLVPKKNAIFFSLVYGQLLFWFCVYSIQ